MFTFRVIKPIIYNGKRMSSIAVSFNNGIKTITMTDKKTRNALSIEMMDTLAKEIREVEHNCDVRAVVITSNDTVFSAGHNLKELTPETGRVMHEKVFASATNLMFTMIDSPVPIIAKVDGIAMAAGCQLVAQCDLAFCTPRSQFSTPGANFGVFCSTPGVALARCMPKMSSMKMLLTGLPIDSNQALRTGLVTDVSENLDETIEMIAKALNSKSRAIVENGKRFFYKQIQTDIRTAYQLGENQMVDTLGTPDGQEGVRCFVTKTKPQWKNKN